LDSRITRDVALARKFLGSLYLLEGRYEEAEKQFSHGVSFANTVGELSWRHESHSELAYLYLAAGNLEKASEECHTALECAVEEKSIRRQIDSLHLLGIIYVSMGSLDKAQRTADELRDLIETWLNTKLMRYYHHLTGMIELEKENFPKAVENFKNAVMLLPFQHYEWHFRLPVAHSLFLESLAYAYYRSGDLEAAQEQYEKIVNLTIGKLWHGDVFANSCYMLGKVSEQLGQREKAIEHFDKFLLLSGNADPGIREVDEAKERLTALKKQ
jgi:tetratricopeptide (TPR) repeat protein